jgi:hypothetical protein
MFTGAVLKGYGGLHLTLPAYRELLKIRWEGSRLRQAPTDGTWLGHPAAIVVDVNEALAG